MTSREKYTKHVMKPNFKDGYLFSKKSFAIEMGKTELNVNKPVYLGKTILVLSKALIYEFHSDYMQPQYGNNVKLCYVGSFVHKTETRFCKVISKDVERRFDTSGYSNFISIKCLRTKIFLLTLRPSCLFKMTKQFGRCLT